MTVIICSIEPAVCWYSKPTVSASSRLSWSLYYGRLSLYWPPLTSAIPLPMPVTMHICHESRLVTQKSTIVKFDVDQTGAWVNPRREFCPDIDTFLTDSFMFFGLSDRYDMARFIKSNSDSLVHHEQCKTRAEMPSITCDVECERCREVIDEFVEILDVKRRLGLENELPLAFPRSIILIFWPVTGSCGSTRQTAVKLIRLNREKGWLLNEATKDPMLVIGGEDSKWKFAPPQFEFFAFFRGTWPA
ncbi:hypothetical protein F5Y06DRAFT_271999 [Hypoxylon sp. FL0890]|nr:hypothetical protein F5Y06DRAFT_271999 [Hypoxylon sp. FL0890]